MQTHVAKKTMHLEYTTYMYMYMCTTLHTVDIHVVTMSMCIHYLYVMLIYEKMSVHMYTCTHVHMYMYMCTTLHTVVSIMYVMLIYEKMSVIHKNDVKGTYMYMCMSS